MKCDLFCLSWVCFGCGRFSTSKFLMVRTNTSIFTIVYLFPLRWYEWLRSHSLTIYLFLFSQQSSRELLFSQVSDTFLQRNNERLKLNLCKKNAKTHCDEIISNISMRRQQNWNGNKKKRKIKWKQANSSLWKFHLTRSFSVSDCITQ